MTTPQFESPTERFEAMIRILRFSASVCGIDLLRDNYQMNWITYTLFTSVASYYGFVFLTIWNNYEDDWLILIRSTVTVGTACQGVSKLFTFISNKNVIYDMHRMLHDTYEDCEQLGWRFTSALHSAVSRTRKGMLTLMLFYVIGYIGLVTTPVIWLLVTGERFLVIDFHVPGLDLATDMGYFCTLGFQTVLVICFAFGLYCGDLVALVYLQQSFMFSNIFAAKVESLNELLDDPLNRSKNVITKDLKDIVIWHQTFSEFTKNCNNLFYYVITVQIITAFCSTVLSIFLIVIGAWPGAYTYVIIAICCLYMYCILGTENENAIQQFSDNIYGIHWYNMNVSQQKIVLQVLLKTQNPQTIEVAGVMPLSVNTALRITKTVYSITMAMIRFLTD